MMAAGEEIPNYRGWAIVSVFLFWIVGIAAVAKSNEVNIYKARGNLVMAKRASNSARTLCLIATILSVAAVVLIIVLVIALPTSTPSYR